MPNLTNSDLNLKFVWRFRGSWLWRFCEPESNTLSSRVNRWYCRRLSTLYFFIDQACCNFITCLIY